MEITEALVKDLLSLLRASNKDNKRLYNMMIEGSHCAGCACVEGVGEGGTIVTGEPMTKEEIDKYLAETPI